MSKNTRKPSLFEKFKNRIEKRLNQSDQRVVAYLNEWAKITQGRALTDEEAEKVVQVYKASGSPAFDFNEGLEQSHKLTGLYVHPDYEGDMGEVYLDWDRNLSQKDGAEAFTPTEEGGPTLMHELAHGIILNHPEFQKYANKSTPEDFVWSVIQDPSIEFNESYRDSLIAEAEAQKERDWSKDGMGRYRNEQVVFGGEEGSERVSMEVRSHGETAEYQAEILTDYIRNYIFGPPEEVKEKE